MRNPIRVLHYGMSSSVGGIENFIMNVYRNIDRNKIQFDFLVSDTDISFSEEIKRLGGQIYCLPSRRENLLDHYKKLNVFLKEHPEHTNIHVHLNTCSYIGPITIAKKFKEKKIIAHSHNIWSGKSQRIRMLHKFNKRKVTRYSDLLLACSIGAGIYMFGDNYVKSKKFTLMKNGIESSKYKFNELIRNRVRKSMNIEKKFVIGHVGRLSYQKNHEFIIDIFSHIKKMNDKAILLLIGGGELEDLIKVKIKKLGLEDSVIMLGIQNEIPDLLQAMDVFLFPSHFEGFGIAALESQASGLKTIVSDVLPSDVNITELLTMISLEEPASYWAEHVLKYDSRNINQRGVYNIKVAESGFDILETVKYLENIYLSAK